MSRWAARLLPVALFLLAGVAAAGAGTLGHEEALAALDDSTPETRRLGAAALGEHGTMQDVPRLARALRDPDQLVRALAEGGMWRIWSRSGDQEIDHLLAKGVEAMSDLRGNEAVETFTRVIERRPDFAEGWNKRATVYYLLGEYRKSLDDCDQVMRRNPYHFGALSGYGMIFLKLGDPARALAYFERALAVNPNLTQVEESVEVLRELVLRRRRDAI